MIYADNAATTKLDEEAFAAMKPYLLNDYSNVSQPYSFSRNSKSAIKESREIIAKCINAEPDEIYFTSGGSESDNWVIRECADFNSERKGIITSLIEHHAVLKPCEFLQKNEYPISYLSVDEYGLVDNNGLKEKITDTTKLVSIMFVNNEIGTVQNIKELALISHNHGSLFHTDAVQAVGHIKVDVKQLDVDFLSASAHKFNGPKGMGFLYIKNGINLSSLIYGGAQERGMRAGTENVASIVGMAYALKNNCKNIEQNSQHLTMLEDILIDGLNEYKLNFVRNGDKNHVPGLVSLSFKNFSGEMLLHRMDLKGICISTGSACDSKNTQISHVIKSINLSDEYAAGTIRISLGKCNTVEDVIFIADTLGEICRK